MYNVYVNYIQLIFFINFISGCVTGAISHTAITTPKNTFSGSVGIGRNSITLSNKSKYNHSILEKTKNISSFSTNSTIRYGLNDNTDIGINITVPGLISFESKLNVFERANNFISLGAGLGKIVFTTIKPSKQKISIMDKVVSLYYTYEINKKILFNTKSFYNIRSIYEETYKSNYHFIGVGLGFSINWLFFDITILKDIIHKSKIFKQFSIGYLIK